MIKSSKLHCTKNSSQLKKSHISIYPTDETHFADCFVPGKSADEYQPSTCYEYHQGVAPGKLFNQSKQNRPGSEKGGGALNQSVCSPSYAKMK